MKAAMPTTVLVLDRSEFAHMLTDFPEDQEAIMRALAAKWKGTCNQTRK